MDGLNIQMQNIRLQLANLQSLFENMVMLIQNNGLQNFGSQIQNMGIQMMNIGIQMFNIGIQNFNIGINDLNMKNQIDFIELQIKNIKKNINNMDTSNINNVSFQMNNNIGIQMNKDISKIYENNNKKIEVTFTTTIGTRNFIIFDYGTPISDMLRKYLEEIKRPELINKISFSFKGRDLNYQDQTKIEDYFKNTSRPIIIVNNPCYLSGSKIPFNK